MSIAWKTVRVFISSTFRDTQAERDYLVRFVFPRLREQLLPRRIHLVDVDLRWGVTNERDASEVCREIIDECRPRFLCMLGGRYGTTPKGKELSITADEVHFGVLDDHREGTYAFFYFRHGAVSEKMDKASPGSIREPKHSENAAKLAQLKQEIRKSKYKPYIYSPRWNESEHRLLDLKVFGDRVAGDILASIDDEFGGQGPEQPDGFAEENAAMDAFAAERGERFVLGSRGAVFKELLVHAGATDGNSYVCLTGGSGSGKSALLAFLSQHPALNALPSVLVIRHFVGVSPGSTDVRRTLRRLCHELKAGCPKINADIPNHPEKLRIAFLDFLRQACAEKRVVLLVDGVDQFDPSPYSAGLAWLPEALPANGRVILSALRGPALEELRRRPGKLHEIELKALTADDGEAIVERFRIRYRKEFEPEQRAALLAKTDAGTPLYLLAVLEELRTLGAYEEINRRIAELPPTTDRLFAWILERLENDDGFRDASGRRVGNKLVSRFAGLLGASRHGLSQPELTDLLVPADPEGNVAALLRLLSPYLMRRGELIGFYHRQFRAAATEAYLQNDGERCEAHQQLADYFRRKSDPNGDRTWSGSRHRGLVELPYHQTHGRMWDDLYALLTDFGFLEERCDSDIRERSTFGTLAVLSKIEPELRLRCEACGLAFRMEGNTLDRLGVARTFCPHCRNTVRIVNRQGIGDLKRKDCYAIVCRECGHESLLKKAWFSDNVQRAWLRCETCGTTLNFVEPKIQGERISTGVFGLQEDYQAALAQWPTDVQGKAQRDVIALFLRSIGTEHHSWRQTPKLLFQQIFASLWWCPGDIRAEVRRLCRGYEDRYNARGPWIRRKNRPAEHGSLQLRESGLPIASCLLFCNDGKTLVAGTTTGEILVLDVLTGRYDLTPLGTRHVCMIGHAPPGDNGDELIVVCGNGNVLVLSLEDRRVVPRASNIRNVASVAISRSGELLAVGTGLGQIRLFETRTGSLISEHTGRRAPVIHLAFSGGEKWLLAIDVGGHETVFEGRGLAVEKTRSSGCAPDILLPNPIDDSWWISRSSGCETIEGPMLTVARKLDLEVRGACAGTTSPDGGLIAIGDISGRVVVDRPLQASSVVHEFRMSGEIRAMAISNDLRLLALADNAGTYEVHRLDAPRSGPRESAIQAVTQPCYLHDGSAVVLGTTGNEGVLLMEPFLETAETLPGSFAFEGPADSALTCNRWAVAGRQGYWKGWDVASRTELGSMGAAGNTCAVAVSPDGSLVATGHGDGFAVLWDFDSGGERGRSKLHNDSILALSFLPQEAKLVSIGGENQVRQWLLKAENPSSGETHSYVAGQEGTDGGFLKAVRTKLEWSQGVGPLSGGLAIDRRGNRLAVAAELAVKILDPKDGTEMFRLAELEAEWIDLRFSPDDLLLLAISSDGVCCVWDIETRRILARYLFPGGLTGCSWRPDGCKFAVVHNRELILFSIEGREPGSPVVRTLRQSVGSYQVVCPHTSCGYVWSVRSIDMGNFQLCPDCRKQVGIGGAVHRLDRFCNHQPSERKE